MVRVNVVFNPGTSRAVADLLDALRFVIGGTKLQPGCLGCSAWSDPDLTVHYVESWSSEEDLRHHVVSSLFTSLLAVVESMNEPPHVQFDFLSASRGLDYVAEVRGEQFE